LTNQHLTRYDGPLLNQGTVMKYLRWAIITLVFLITSSVIAGFITPQMRDTQFEAAWGLAPILLVLFVVYAAIIGLRRLSQGRSTGR